MRKCSFFLSAVFLFSILFTNYASLTASAAFQPDFNVESKAAYMVNLDTDVVVYEKNPNEKMYPASLTKIMTAIIALEKVSDIQNTMVTAEPTIFDELYGLGASTADFRPNEVASMNDLLYGMLLQSACEAASIIAYHVGGSSIQNFVTMMNDKAKALGAVNTHFVNAHGLYDENQYTTAYDMYLITKYALSLPGFSEIVNTVSYDLKPTNKHAQPRTVLHTNLLMNKSSEYYYSYAKGVKTGTLDESGQCLISTASKDGYTYLLVTMGAPLKDDKGQPQPKKLAFVDGKNLYEWAFNTFQLTSVIKPTEDIMEFKVRLAKDKDYVMARPETDFSTLLPKNLDESTIQRIKPAAQELTAPVKKGTLLGTMELRLADETLTTVNLIAADDVERSELLYMVDMAKSFVSSIWFRTAVYVAVGIILLSIVLRLTIGRKRRKVKYVRKKRKF